VELLEWPEQPLLNVSETHLLLNRLQELLLSKVRGDLEGINPQDLTRLPLERVRLALATNLGRAMLQEWSEHCICLLAHSITATLSHMGLRIPDSSHPKFLAVVLLFTCFYKSVKLGCEWKSHTSCGAKHLVMTSLFLDCTILDSCLLLVLTTKHKLDPCNHKQSVNLMLCI
jgi:hypothetical protein